ncbi:MAG: hypothetical protein AB4058_15200 [Microcystaceae cyanobacterium]
MKHLTNIILWLVALCYLYGATIHLMNILSLTGLNWLETPLKWRILDIVYLLLDITVVIGFFLNLKIAYISFYIAAISQILLYTLLRSWITDVPSQFTLSSEQVSALSSLVIFHSATLILVTLTLIKGSDSEFISLK